MKLRDKQKRFCEEYIVDCNATQAAIRAGYSERTARQIGQENLSKLDIQTYIDELMTDIKSKSVASAEEVCKYLTAVMRGEEKEQVLRLVGDGVQAAYDVDIPTRERLKAAELLGKRYGLFTDRVNVDGVSKVIFSGEEDLID